MLASGSRDSRDARPSSRSGSKPRRSEKRRRPHNHPVSRARRSDAREFVKRSKRNSPLHGIGLDSRGNPNLDEYFKSGSESEGDTMGPCWNLTLKALAAQERQRKAAIAARQEAEAAERRQAAQQREAREDESRVSTHLRHEDLEPSRADSGTEPRTPPQQRNQSRPVAIPGHLAGEAPWCRGSDRSVPLPHAPRLGSRPGPMNTGMASNVPMRTTDREGAPFAERFVPSQLYIRSADGQSFPHRPVPGQFDTRSAADQGSLPLGTSQRDLTVGTGFSQAGHGFGRSAAPPTAPVPDPSALGVPRPPSSFAPASMTMGAPLAEPSLDAGGPGRMGPRADGQLGDSHYPRSYPARQIDDPHGPSALPGPSAVLRHGYEPSFGRPTQRERSDQIWVDEENQSRNGSNSSGGVSGRVYEGSHDYTARSVSDRPVHHSSDLNTSSRESFGSGAPSAIGLGGRSDSSVPNSTQPSTRPSTDAASERPLDVSGDPPVVGASTAVDASFRSPLTPRQLGGPPPAPGLSMRSPMACLSTEEAPNAQLAGPHRPMIPSMDLSQRFQQPAHHVGGNENHGGGLENRRGGNENRSDNRRDESADRDKDTPRRKSRSARDRSASLHVSHEVSPRGREGGRGRSAERPCERGRPVLGEVPSNGAQMPPVQEIPGSSPEGTAFVTPMSSFQPRRLSLPSREDPRPEAVPRGPAGSGADAARVHEDPVEPPPQPRPREFAGRMSPVRSMDSIGGPLPPPRTAGADSSGTGDAPVVNAEPVGHMPPPPTVGTGTQTANPQEVDGASNRHPRPHLIPNGVTRLPSDNRRAPYPPPPQGARSQGLPPPPTNAQPWANPAAHGLLPNQMNYPGQMGPFGQHQGGPGMGYPGGMGYHGGGMVPGGMAPGGMVPGGYQGHQGGMGYHGGMGYPGMYPGFPGGMPPGEGEEDRRGALATAASVARAGAPVLGAIGSATMAGARAAAPVLGEVAVAAGNLAITGIGAAAQAGIRLARGDPDAPPVSGATTSGPMRDPPPAMPPAMPSMPPSVPPVAHSHPPPHPHPPPSTSPSMPPPHPLPSTSTGTPGGGGPIMAEVGTSPAESGGNPGEPLAGPVPPAEPGGGGLDDIGDGLPSGDSPFGDPDPPAPGDPDPPPPGSPPGPADEDDAGGNGAAPTCEPEAPTAFTAPPPKPVGTTVAVQVSPQQIVPRKQPKKREETPRSPKNLKLVQVDLPKGATALASRPERYPLRRRIDRLDAWKNERVIYERKPGSILPTLRGYYIAQPNDEDGGLHFRPEGSPQGVLQDNGSDASPAYSPLQDADMTSPENAPSVATSSPEEPRERLRKSPAKNVSKLTKAARSPKNSVARGTGRGRQAAAQKKTSAPKRKVAPAKRQAPAVVAHEPSPPKENEASPARVIGHGSSPPNENDASPVREAADPTTSGGLTERLFSSPASTGDNGVGDVPEVDAEPDIQATQLDEDSESSAEDLPEPAPKKQKLWLHQGEGGSSEIPAVPGSKGPVSMHGGLNIPGLVGCTLVIPPESWNEEEVLPSDRTILFYIMEAHDQTVYAKIDGVSQRVARGDTFVVEPGRRWVIVNESTTQQALVKMLLVLQA